MLDDDNYCKSMSKIYGGSDIDILNAMITFVRSNYPDEFEEYLSNNQE